MESSQINQLNITVYAKDENTANKYASKIASNQQQGTNIFNETVNNLKLNVFTSNPEFLSHHLNRGIVGAVVIIYTGTENKNIINNMLNCRAETPIKILVSNDKESVSLFDQKLEIISFEELENGSLKNKLVKEYTEDFKKLKTLFDQFKDAESGKMKVENLEKLLKEMNPSITKEEITKLEDLVTYSYRMLSNLAPQLSLSNNILNKAEGTLNINASQNIKNTISDAVESIASKDVSFDDLLLLYRYGRNNGDILVKLAKVEQQILKITQYFKNTVKEGDDETKGLKGDINISPKDFNEDNSVFETGFSLKSQVLIGTEAQKEFLTLPYAILNNPISLSIEINMLDRDVDYEIVSTFESFIENVIYFVPENYQKYVKYCKINPRKINDKKIGIDISYAGPYAGYIVSILSNLQNSLVKYSGLFNLSFQTKFSIFDVIKPNISLEQLAEFLSNIRIIGKTEISQLKLILDALKSILFSFEKTQFTKFLAGVLFAIRAILLIQNVNLTLKYDSDQFAKIIIEALDLYKPLSGLIEIEETEENKNKGTSQLWLENYQPMISDIVSQFSVMGVMVLEPYKPLLESLDLDHLDFVVRIPTLLIQPEINITSIGLNDFIKKIFE